MATRKQKSLFYLLLGVIIIGLFAYFIFSRKLHEGVGKYSPLEVLLRDLANINLEFQSALTRLTTPITDEYNYTNNKREPIPNNTTIQNKYINDGILLLKSKLVDLVTNFSKYFSNDLNKKISDIQTEVSTIAAKYDNPNKFINPKQPNSEIINLMNPFKLRFEEISKACIQEITKSGGAVVTTAPPPLTKEQCGLCAGCTK